MYNDKGLTYSDIFQTHADTKTSITVWDM